jgi:hypothetical protein
MHTIPGRQERIELLVCEKSPSKASKFIQTMYVRSSLSRLAWIFFSGSVDQCAVGMIEKRAGIHVNPGGMMVTWFGYHCK